MIADVNVLLGRWAFRRLPAEDAGALESVLRRAGITRALVGSLDAVLNRDPGDGNERLYRALEGRRGFFVPAVTVDPTYAGWERELERGRERGCAAVRTYPHYQGWELHDPRVAPFHAACVELGLPVILTREVEDHRQRHALDRPAEWLGADVTHLVEGMPGLQVVVVNARADDVRLIALSLADADRARVFFDVSAVWGPFVDDLAACVGELGADRFVFGSHAALKTPETAVWRVRHSELSETWKEGIFHRHVQGLFPALVD